MDIYDCIDNIGKFKTLHSCITCGFVGGSRSAYRAHKRTYKHKYNMTGDPKYKLVAIDKEELYCETCDYTAKYPKDIEKHLLTTKHKIKSGIELPKNTEKKEWICKCGVSYEHASGLSRHRKKCKVINNKPEVNEEINELTNKLYDQVKELIQMKDEQIEFVRVKDQQIRKLEEKNKSLEEINKSLLTVIEAFGKLYAQK